VKRLLLLLAASCAAPRTYASFSDVDYGYPSARTIWGRRAKLEVHYAEIDRGGDRAPLVLLHPWGFNLTVWNDVAPALAESRRMILIDLPAHGKSGKSEAFYSMERLAAAVLDVMDDAGVDRAILGGNSLGGAASIATALAAPERTLALILIATPGGRPYPDVMVRATKQLVMPHQMETLSEEAWRAGLASVPLGDSPTAEKIREDFIAMRGMREWPQWCRSTTAVLNAVAAYAPELERVTVPTLVVHAEDDLLVTRGLNEGFVERIRSAELVVLEGCGHLAEIQCPEKVLPPIRKFLATLP
jgi:pimeloyl-ACP methyl ester carboxylesterase